MEKAEIKAVSEILGNSAKFKRARFLIIAGLIIFAGTLILIAGIGFYTGAISYHGGAK